MDPGRRGRTEAEYSALIDGAFYAVGDLGTLLSSEDGATFTPLGGQLAFENLQFVGRSTNRFIAVGNRGQVLSSFEGEDWKLEVVPLLRI